MATPEKLKIQHLTWDGDKDPDGFHLWLDGFGSFVNSMDGGLELEDFIDSKLYRALVSRAAVPSFILDDPDFAATGCEC